MMTIKDVCENTNNEVVIRDNGNGALLYNGPSFEASKEKFSVRECRAITALARGVIELYARHENER